MTGHSGLDAGAPAGADRRAALHDVPEHLLRSLFLTLSHQRWLGRVATGLPVTRPMVGRFVAGVTLEEALPALHALRTAGLDTTVDVLGESVTSAADAETAVERYLVTLDAIAREDLVRNVSLKLSQMGLGIDREACRANLERIVRRAAALGAFVRVDMEDHTTVDATLAIVRELRGIHPATGVVIQAALRRSAADLDALVADGVPVRLCKGAYKEPAAVAFGEKAEVDASYRALAARLLDAAADDGPGRPAPDAPHVVAAFATHDERMIGHVVRIARERGLGRERFEFQMLFGVRRDLQERLVGAGYRVRVYVPYGGQWYPYFMRRLAERPANVTFLLRSLLREG